MATPTSSLAVENWYESTLSSGISSSDTTIPLNNVPTGSQGYLVIEPDSASNREIIFYTSKTSNSVVLTSAADGRGQDGTSAVSHSSGATVRMQVTAGYWQALQSGAGLNAGISGSKIADASLDLGAKASVFDGWVPVSDSWSYASASTITVPSDATAKYSVGDKIKLVQSSTTKYFYVTAVASTVLTVTGGSDYTVANSAISGIYYSKATTPLGFPQWFNYTPTWTSSGTAPSIGNGTLTGKFAITGKKYDFRVSLIAGSTTTVGTGNYSFTLPSTPSVTIQDYPIGICTGVDAGSIYMGTISYESSGKFWGLFHSTTVAGQAAGRIGAAAPFAFGNTDQYYFIGSYEAA